MHKAMKSPVKIRAELIGKARLSCHILFERFLYLLSCHILPTKAHRTNAETLWWKIKHYWIGLIKFLTIYIPLTLGIWTRSSLRLYNCKKKQFMEVLHTIHWNHKTFLKLSATISLSLKVPKKLFQCANSTSTFNKLYIFMYICVYSDKTATGLATGIPYIMLLLDKASSS